MRLECACLVYLIRQESYNLISFLPKIHLAFLYIEVVLVSFYYILYIQFLQYLKNQTKEYYYSLDTYITLLHLLYWYIKVVVGVMGFISREQVFFFYNPIIQWTKVHTFIQNYPISRQWSQRLLWVFWKSTISVAESTSPQFNCLENQQPHYCCTHTVAAKPIRDSVFSERNQQHDFLLPHLSMTPKWFHLPSMVKS